MIACVEAPAGRFDPRASQTRSSRVSVGVAGEVRVRVEHFLSVGALVVAIIAAAFARSSAVAANAPLTQPRRQSAANGRRS